MDGRPPDVVGALRSTVLFETASPTTLTTLAEASRHRILQRGETMFIAGERATAVHLVVNGMVRVFATSLDGSEPTLAVLMDGALVGELGVLDDVPRSASVAAMRRSEIIEIPARAFRAAYETEPAIAQRLVALLAERLRTTTDGLADLTYLDLGGRLAKYLLTEADRLGADTITVTLTQSELGQMIGGARQTVNQLMHALERAELIRIEGRTVRLLDPEGLRLRAMSAR